MAARLDHRDYYRLPWSYADNGISWLEPTSVCNLRCEGCYREVGRHKTIEEVRTDLEVFRSLRKSDCMSIAGGDPLVYPWIVDLVRMVREMGWKPVVNTNGVALTDALLQDLKRVGVFGFTFHIDTSQKRPNVAAATERDLNPIRLHYAEMLARAGGIACSFNATVSETTVHEVPDLVNWARDHADIVHTMVFILYRSPVLMGDFDFYANGERSTLSTTYKETPWGGKKTLMAADVVDYIRRADPLYAPAAYLNGTANPSSLKWLLANRIVLDGKTMGYVSPKFMELVQTVAHFLTGTYLAYAGPKAVSRGKAASLLGSVLDGTMRGILARMARTMLRKPAAFFQPGYMQSIMIIQPVTFENDGRQDMCDSCPDITVHDGKLVWSCRLEEMKAYGVFLQSVPRKNES